MHRIVILEPGHSGHLLVYVRLLAKAAERQGIGVILATSEQCTQSLEYMKHIASQGLNIEVHTNISPNLRWALTLTGSEGHLIVPHADPILRQVLLSRLSRGQLISLLIMRDPSWEDPVDLSRRARKIVKQAAIRLVSLMPGVRLLHLRQPGYNPSGPGELFVEDPVIIEEPISTIRIRAQALRAELGLNPDHDWIGVVGGMQPRKNPLLVAEAAYLAGANRLRPVGVAYIGPWADQDKSLRKSLVDLCEARGLDLVLHDRLLTNSEVNAACLAVDVVTMAYSSDAPNSTLGKCVGLGAQLAAAGGPSIARFVASLGMGPTAELSAPALASVISYKLDEEPPKPRDVASWLDFGERLVAVPCKD